MKLPSVARRKTTTKERVAAALARIVGSDGLITTPRRLKVYETDGYHAQASTPLAVVLPTTTAQVQAVMHCCAAEGVAVAPRGSGTGLTGGAIPLHDAVLIGTAKMRGILDFNATNGLVRVQAGVRNEAVSRHTRPHGWFYAPDPSSRRACTIGGNIATNSGGAACLKYGVTVNNVAGLTMVMRDGELLEVGGATYDDDGLDLAGVICGSEGQLGLVTEALLRLTPVPPHVRAALLGFARQDDALACASAILAAGVLPVALEYMDRTAARRCDDFSHSDYPSGAAALLIVEVDGAAAEVEAEATVITGVARSQDAMTVRVADDLDAAARLWQGRNAIYGAMGRLNNYYALDCAVPLRQFGTALAMITDHAARFCVDHATVLHAGDGTVHSFLLYDANNPDDESRAHRCGDAIRAGCVALGGALTSEYGVGLEKRDLLDLQYRPQDLAQQLAVRQAFAPDLGLNPGKVFPPAVEAAE